MNDLPAQIIHFALTLSFALAILFLAAALLSYLDRKVQAMMQDRYGPAYYGPFGAFQGFYDAIKLLLKENIRSRQSDNAIFLLAPIVFIAPILTTFVALPFSPYMTGSAIATGILLYVACSSLDVLAVFMAGWGGNNKYSLIGGIRGAAQMISYELPLVLSLVGTVMLTSALSRGGIGSISFTQIIAAQMQTATPWLWFIFLQPLGLIVYLICGLAETNRSPFDLPESESELVAGYLTEYSGVRWAMFMLGEYGNVCIVAAVATSLFLGGWSGPGAAAGWWTQLLGAFWGSLAFNVIALGWFIAKMSLFIFILMWVRATLPRLRADQLMQFAWLGLIPLTLVNILVTAGILLLPWDITLRLLVAGVSNWGMLVALVLTSRRLMGSATAPRRVAVTVLPREPATAK